MKFYKRLVLVEKVWLIYLSIKPDVDYRDHENIIAHIQFVVSRKTCAEPTKTMYINHLEVKEEWRNQGLASHLLDETFRVARSRDVKVIRLNAVTVTDPKRNIYEKFGFYYIEAGQPEMVKNLGESSKTKTD